MKTVLYTQRVEVVKSYCERRDCADQNIARFLSTCGFLPLPVPNVKELAEKTGLSEEEIVLAVEANGEVESIYQSVYQSDGSEIYLLDRLKDKKNAQEELENKLLIEELLQQLSGREQQLIKMRYFENATQSQIAAKLGTSQVQVSRMEKKILLQMRKYMSQG